MTSRVSIATAPYGNVHLLAAWCGVYSFHGNPPSNESVNPLYGSLCQNRTGILKYQSTVGKSGAFGGGVGGSASETDMVSDGLLTSMAIPSSRGS